MKRIKFNFIVLGAGGTGGDFLVPFSQYLMKNDSNIDWERSVIIDGDSVELKNCSRQHFYPEDEGLNKAGVLGTRLNETFETRWKAVGDYVLKTDDIAKYIKQYQGKQDKNTIPVLVGCVDNHGCRLLMEEVFNNTDSIIYLDSANEFSTGECVFALKVNGKVIGPPRSFYFPDIKSGDTRNRGEISCGELNSVAPQHTATNTEAGQILLTACCQIMTNSFKPGMVIWNSFNFQKDFYPAKSE